MIHAALALVAVSILAASVFGVVTLARRKGPENQYRREMHRLQNPNLKRQRSRRTSWEAGTADAGGSYYLADAGGCSSGECGGGD
jgi:hypothetical protein